VERLESVDSTNRYALDAARAGAGEGLVVVADHQTAGRGRMGRVWEAPPGASLLVSVLLRPARPPGDLHLCTAAAALAMADAIADVAGVAVDLKWPNDLFAGGRKLGGLLAEADLAGAQVRAVVVGIGVNVAWDEFPGELAGIATACNLEAGRPVDREDLLTRFLEHLASRLDSDDGELLADYRGRLATIGKQVRVDFADGSVRGRARAVDDAGALVLDTDDGRTLKVAAGDVVHLRAEDDRRA
jgi:BirA family biotin operon repressor/biotin-[acetyl-CoA-carboxylase] ligase